MIVPNEAKRRKTMENSLSEENCALECCNCSLKAGDGVMVGGEFYCCGECATGDGCAHDDCKCGEA